MRFIPDSQVNNARLPFDHIHFTSGQQWPVFVHYTWSECWVPFTRIQPTTRRILPYFIDYWWITCYLTVNNLLLNSCYLGWIITLQLRKDLEFSKSSVFKRKKKWSYKDFAESELEPGRTTRSRILRLSTWAICELTDAAGKRSFKSFRPQRTTVQALQLQALAKYGRRQEAFVSHLSTIFTSRSWISADI